MARPGFVLDVDERTPPLVVPFGDAFRLERFPLGTKVVYPADSFTPLLDLDEATNAALDAPLDAAPLTDRLQPGTRLTIVFDDSTTPVPQMRRPDVRATVIEAVLGRAARAGVDDVALIAANGLHRRLTPDELQRLLGERVFRSFFADGLLRNHDAVDDSELTALDGGPGNPVAVNARVAASDLVIFVHVVADPRRCTGLELLAGVGSAATCCAVSGAVSEAVSPGRADPAPWAAALDAAVPVFQIDVVLDNDVFPAGLALLSKREWEWSIREQVAWRGIRRGLAVAPVRLRRRIIDRSLATLSATAVFAGQPAAVALASRAQISDQLRVAVPNQVDVGVLGVGQHTPYSVNAPVNPVLAAWQGLVGLLGSHTGRGLVRDGGAVIIHHPMPNDFSPLHHPSYVDFYADVLPRTADPEEIRADVEPKYAQDPWYTHLYRTSQAFHGVHPLRLWYEIAAAKERFADVVWVGADREVVGRLGFRAASTLADALEIVSSTVGRTPQLGYLHASPNILVDVA
jgi:lactate racemase